MIYLLYDFKSLSLLIVNYDTYIQDYERDVTRFLWFNNPNEPEKVEGNLTVYRFCRVPFGIVCSPFLLEATLKFHLKKEGSAIANMIHLCR